MQLIAHPSPKLTVVHRRRVHVPTRGGWGAEQRDRGSTHSKEGFYVGWGMRSLLVFFPVLVYSVLACMPPGSTANEMVTNLYLRG